MLAKISIDGSDPIKGTTIEVDGHRIEGAVHSLEISQQAGFRPVISINLAVIDHVDAEGQVRVAMTSTVRDALIALGWTPPVEG